MTASRTVARWLLLCALSATLAGSASALFLTSLDWVTAYRESHPWLTALLPLAGLLTGLAYHYVGRTSSQGTRLLLQEFHRPTAPVPLRMAPLVLLGTLATHLTGGSAGREGTAVQMGGTLADQLARPLRMNTHQRQTLLLMGMAAGFAAVFGTPLAGAIFALELALWRRAPWDCLPILVTAYAADWVCQSWGIAHTAYRIAHQPQFAPATLVWIALAAVAFGLTARLFVATVHGATLLYGRITYPPLRPLVGGIVLVGIFWLSGTTQYMGLGVPTIVESFDQHLSQYTFAIKLLLTSLTLAAGFKGGEATPLFFVGATLGNALVWLLPLPMDLLAGLGFVAVFGAATHTPLACAVMGMELFGFSHTGAVYFLLCSWLAHWVAGPHGVFGHREQFRAVPADADKI